MTNMTNYEKIQQDEILTSEMTTGDMLECLARLRKLHRLEKQCAMQQIEARGNIKEERKKKGLVRQCQ